VINERQLRLNQSGDYISPGWNNHWLGFTYALIEPEITELLFPGNWRGLIPGKKMNSKNTQTPGFLRDPDSQF
jgi:hypothetical protein